MRAFLRDGSKGVLPTVRADSYSDIDLHLSVVESAWDEVWNGRRREIERVAPILASLDIMGVFGVGCLIEGPVKLDVFFEREGGLASRPRIAVKRLWGAPEIYERFKIGDDLGEPQSSSRSNRTCLDFCRARRGR